jgi:hypothetical protein
MSGGLTVTTGRKLAVTTGRKLAVTTGRKLAVTALRKLAATALASTLFACAPLVGAGSAQAATITPSLAPDQLGANGALTLTANFAEGSTTVPKPVRTAVLMLPAGLGLDVPSLRSCSAARLRARGPSGCPAQSQLGHGHALVESYAGSQLIAEHITLWVFLGPLHGFQPTVEVLGQGYTPLLKRIVLAGTVMPAHAPYGEELVMDIPPIATVPLEPDAAVATLTLTVGASRAPAGANTVVVPTTCPPGGFPFAAQFTYADGSTGSSLATALCPR